MDDRPGKRLPICICQVPVSLTCAGRALSAEQGSHPLHARLPSMQLAADNPRGTLTVVCFRSCWSCMHAMLHVLAQYRVLGAWGSACVTSRKMQTGVVLHRKAKLVLTC